MNYIRIIYNSSLQLLLAIFPLSTAWIYFEPIIDGVKWQYGTLLWYASEVVLVMCTVSCCLFLYTNHVRGKQIQFRWTKERLFVLSLASFCAYLYGRSFFTLYPDIALQQSVHVLEAVLFFFCILISPLENKVLIRALVLGAVFQSGLGIAQFFLQSTWGSTLLGTSLHLAAEAGSSVVVTEGERWLRAYGTFSHPNMYGGYLALVLILFLYFRFQVSDSKQILGSRLKILDYLLVVALTMGIFVSFSRSAWIALFLGLLFLAFLLKRRNVGKNKGVTRYMLCVTCFITFTTLSILFYPLIMTRLGATSSNEQQSITERISGNRESIELVHNNILFGVGPGYYTVALMQKDSSHPIWEYQPVHNVFLLMLVEIGIVGVLFFALCALFFIKTFQLSFVDLMFVIPLVPLALFDHYLWSSLIGLFLFGMYIVILCRYKKVNTR